MVVACASDSNIVSRQEFVLHRDRKTMYPTNFKLQITLVAPIMSLISLAQVVWDFDSFMLKVGHYSYFVVHECHQVQYLNVIKFQEKSHKTMLWLCTCLTWPDRMIPVFGALVELMPQPQIRRDLQFFMLWSLVTGFSCSCVSMSDQIISAISMLNEI